MRNAMVLIWIQAQGPIVRIVVLMLLTLKTGLVTTEPEREMIVSVGLTMYSVWNWKAWIVRD